MPEAYLEAFFCSSCSFPGDEVLKGLVSPEAGETRGHYSFIHVRPDLSGSVVREPPAKGGTQETAPNAL